LLRYSVKNEMPVASRTAITIPMVSMRLPPSTTATIADMKTATSKIRMIGSLNFERNCIHRGVRLGGVSSFLPCCSLMVRTDSEESPLVRADSGRSRKGIISADIIPECFSSFGRNPREENRRGNSYNVSSGKYSRNVLSDRNCDHPYPHRPQRYFRTVGVCYR